MAHRGDITGCGIWREPDGTLAGGIILGKILLVLVLAALVWQLIPALTVRWVKPRALAQWIREGKPDLVVVDIRTPEAYKVAHIETAVSVPYARIRQMARLWKPDQPLVLVCRTGYRGIQAQEVLRRRGLKQVYCLSGGMLGWMAWRERQGAAGV